MARLDRVSRTYPGVVPVDAVSDVSLDVAGGDVVTITGPSGSGKTTLLGILGLLDTATGGAVFLRGEDVSGLADRDRTRLRSHTIGFVFQQFHLLPHLSALANVEAALLGRGLSGAKRRELAAGALERVDLGHRGDHRPGQLSGGEQQRVALARATVTEPSLILADEPTGNLDSVSASNVLDLLAQSARGGTGVVIVTHDPRVTEYATMRVEMSDGRIRSVSGVGR